MLKARKSISLFLNLPFFFCSQAQVREAILFSQYHKKGLLSIPMAKSINNIISPHLPLIQQTEQELNALRSKVLQVQLKQQKSKKEEQKTLYEKYFDKYGKLIVVIRQCPLNNEWIYSTIGWYNMISFYRVFWGRLLETKDEKELISLANCMSQMHYANDMEHHKKKINPELMNNFYNRSFLSNLQPAVLRKIETIIPIPLNSAKKHFYRNYFHKNIETFLKYVRSADNYTISDLIWLFCTFIKSMNDNPQLIVIFQRYLITESLTLEPIDVELLMQAYQIKGAVNKNIYSIYIKPYILSSKMNSLQNVINMIEFTVCSQSGDANLLKKLYQQVALKYKQEKVIQSRSAETLHFYTHYLLINKQKFKLPDILEKELTTICKNKVVGRNYLTLPKLKSKDNNQKYRSPCLDIKNQKEEVKKLTKSQKTVFEKQYAKKLLELSLEDYEIYEKPVFCCFQLGYALQHKTKGKYIDVEVEGLQYVFTSGNLTRERQIKDEILNHYNIKVIHLDYNYFVLSRFDEDERLKYRKLSR